MYPHLTWIFSLALGQLQWQGNNPTQASRLPHSINSTCMACCTGQYTRHLRKSAHYSRIKIAPQYQQYGMLYWAIYAPSQVWHSVLGNIRAISSMAFCTGQYTRHLKYGILYWAIYAPSQVWHSVLGNIRAISSMAFCAGQYTRRLKYGMLYWAIYETSQEICTLFVHQDCPTVSTVWHAVLGNIRAISSMAFCTGQYTRHLKYGILYWAIYAPSLVWHSVLGNIRDISSMAFCTGQYTRHLRKSAHCSRFL